MAKDEDLIKAEDIAKMFRVDPTTVYKWEREGLLPKRAEAGRHGRWRRADIETVRGRQQDPPGIR